MDIPAYPKHSATCSPTDRRSDRAVHPARTPCDRLLLFELSIGGHYPGYIQHLVRYWNAQQLPGSLDIVVTPQFLEQHADVVEDGGDPRETGVHFISIQSDEEAKLRDRQSVVSRTLRAFQEFDLLVHYAKSLNASRCLIPYLDTRLFPLALGKTLPCQFSGIYFRPTFHYDQLIPSASTLPERLQRFREKTILQRVLANQKLETLFCLDPFVLDYIKPTRASINLIPIADPVQIYPNSPQQVAQLRQEFGIEPHRRIFLLFGEITHRKGIYPLLKAIDQLPPEAAQNLCLLLVGPMINPLEESQILQQISTLQQKLPVQIICVSKFIKDPDIQPFFQLSDVVLAPYQRHVGMSAILVRAAAAQKLVLSSDYGLMGELTRRYGLGETVDSAESSAIAQSLLRLLQTPLDQIGDRAKMQAFAAQNTAERFAKTIFETLWIPPL